MSRVPRFLLVSLGLASLALTAPVAAEAQRVKSAPVVVQKGEASYYSRKFCGRKTASGTPYRAAALTAASRQLPLGTRAKVVNEANGKSVTVKITDRGPFIRGRVVDLSETAAKKLDMKKEGVTPVKVVAKPAEQPTRRLKEAVAEEAREHAQGALIEEANAADFR
jgi:rare lipoprotein A